MLLFILSFIFSALGLSNDLFLAKIFSFLEFFLHHKKEQADENQISLLFFALNKTNFLFSIGRNRGFA